MNDEIEIDVTTTCEVNRYRAVRALVTIDDGSSYPRPIHVSITQSAGDRTDDGSRPTTSSAFEEPSLLVDFSGRSLSFKSWRTVAMAIDRAFLAYAERFDIVLDAVGAPLPAVVVKPRTCSTCVYWRSFAELEREAPFDIERPEDDDEPKDDTQRRRAARRRLGLCVLASVKVDPEMRDGDEDVIATDQSDYRHDLRTSAAFGCVKHLTKASAR